MNPLQWVPIPPGRLVLQTPRSHDQYNTTIYGLADDRYRGVKGGRRVVFCRIRPTSRHVGLNDGTRVDLVSSSPMPSNIQERRAKDFMVVAYLHAGG